MTARPARLAMLFVFFLGPAARPGLAAPLKGGPRPGVGIKPLAGLPPLAPSFLPALDPPATPDSRLEPAALEALMRPPPDLARMDEAAARESAGALFDGLSKNAGAPAQAAPLLGAPAAAARAGAPLKPAASTPRVEPGASPSAPRRAPSSWLASHKGGVTLTLSAALYLSSWGVQAATAGQFAGELMRAMGEAAVIGGLCDYIALKMLFERRWYLPNSGVLPRNREKLVAAIADAVETQWLTPESIHGKLTELDLANGLGRFLETATLENTLGAPAFADLSRNVARYLDSEPFRRFIEDSIRANAPASIRLAKSLGLVDYREISESIGARLRQDVADLPSNPERVRAIEEGIHALGEALREPESAAHEAVDRLSRALADQALAASRGEIGRVVKENLGKLSDEDIRRQIEDGTRTHLDWIRVNGGIFGALFGALFGLIDFALGHASGLLSLLR